MKSLFLVALFLVLNSCQVVETIEIKDDGSGEITIMQRRDEGSYMKMNPEAYLQEQNFSDTNLIFKDLLISQKAIVENMSAKEKLLYRKYENTSIKTVKNSETKENYRQFHSVFADINQLPDLYKTAEYYDNIVHNYALSAEEHYSDLQFFYDGKTFKRTATIISDIFYKKEMEELSQYEAALKSHVFVSDYVLKYRFPKRIKSVSIEKAIVSADKKSVEITFSIFEAKKHPEMTNFEVVFEE